jgi:hypothetical protein
MNRKRKPYVLDRPYIASNPYDGIITLTWEEEGNILAEIKIHQNEVWEEDGVVKRNKRTSYIGGDIDDLLTPEMEYYAGERITGKCVIIESYEPPLPEDPEAFLKKDTEGQIVRVNGRCVYQVELYTYNALEQDILITE